MGAFLKKYSLLLIAAFLMLGWILIKSGSEQNSAPAETFTVGLQSGYPPFEFIDINGKLVGFDVDVAKLIADKLNKKLIIQDMEFEGEILSLKQGKIDAIISGMNITPSRLKEIAMVPYYGSTDTSLSLIFWREIPKGIASLKDLEKQPQYTISVESGSIPEAYIAKYPNIQVKSFQGSLAPLMDVKYGKSIANLVQPDVAIYLQSKHPDIQILSVPLSPEETISGFGIGIKKENTELFHQVQQAIQELRASGELQRLENKWFKGIQE